MTSRPARLACFPLLVAAQALFAQGARPPEELDIAKLPRLYGTHFGRYGKAKDKVISSLNRFVRFSFPSGGKVIEADQHGLYSYFSFAGDFEVSADYEIRALAPPERGYGSSIGIALETGGPAGEVQLMRGFNGDKPPANGYIYTRAIPTETETKYEVQVFPSTMKRGKIGLRREKDELILLAADKWADPLKELSRVPFTKEKITKMRLVADRGGDDNLYDNSIGNLKVRAAEIVGGQTREELERGTNWVKLLCGVVLLSGVGFFVQRWRRERREAAEASMRSPR